MVTELTNKSEEAASSSKPRQVPVTNYMSEGVAIRTKVSYSHALIAHLAHEIAISNTGDHTTLPDIALKGIIEDSLKQIFSSNLSQDIFKIHSLVPYDTDKILVDVKTLISQHDNV